MKTLNKSIVILSFPLLWTSMAYGKVFCPETAELIKQSFPSEIGDDGFIKSLLNPKINKEQLSKKFNKEQLRKIMGNPFTGSKRECKSGGQDVTTNKSDSEKRTVTKKQIRPKIKKDRCDDRRSMVNYNLSQGRITYLNPKRSFKFVKSKENTVSKEEADKKVRETLEIIGVPKNELGDSDIRVLIAASRDSKNKSKVVKRRAEVHVRIGREVNGFPVFDSEAKIAIDNKLQPARLHLRWPDFRLLSGLERRKVRSPDALLRHAVKALSGRKKCNNYSHVASSVAYTIVKQKRDSKQTPLFIPSLVIYATPPEPKENSGEIAQAGMQIVVPLLN